MSTWTYRDVLNDLTHRRNMVNHAIACLEELLMFDAPYPGLRCEDCGLHYGTPDWIDTTIPHEQWKMIYPKHEIEMGIILCANCMVRRASKLPGIVALRAQLEFRSEPGPASLPASDKEGE